MENGTGTCQDIDECTGSPCTGGQCHNLPGGQYTVDECTDSPCIQRDSVTTYQVGNIQ